MSRDRGGVPRASVHVTGGAVVFEASLPHKTRSEKLPHRRATRELGKIHYGQGDGPTNPERQMQSTVAD